eukprot:7388608-Prymnesium_polylepis.1
MSVSAVVETRVSVMLPSPDSSMGAGSFASAGTRNVSHECDYESNYASLTYVSLTTSTPAARVRVPPRFRMAPKPAIFSMRSSIDLFTVDLRLPAVPHKR